MTPEIEVYLNADRPWVTEALAERFCGALEALLPRLLEQPVGPDHVLSALPLVDIMVPFSLAGAITIYVVVMEIGSILENISKLSPELAKYLGFVFEKLRPPEDLPDPGKEEEEDMKK